jgi:anti-sigma factor RsiW
MGPKLGCQEIVGFLGHCWSRELSPEEFRAFNAHLASRPSCVNYLKTYLETIRLGKAALRSDDGPVPADVPEELVRAILATSRWGGVTKPPRRHPMR